MSNVMTYEEWMKKTKGGFTQSRSKALKVVDAALKKYHQTKSEYDKGLALKALIAWQQTKGNDWKKSIRNKEHVAENLYRQLAGLEKKADMFALSNLQNESRAIITDLFQGKQLVFRPGILTKIAGNSKTLGINVKKISTVNTARSVVQNAHTLVPSSSSSSSGTAAKATKLSNDLIKIIVPADLMKDVLAAMMGIMPNFVTELVASCTPFVGVIFSGGTTVVSGCKLAQSAYEQNRAKMHAQRTLSIAEPAAAFAALIRMIERETQQKLEGFVKGLADFGSKLASTLADGGTATNAAIGLASGMIKLLMILRVVVRDIQEKNAANKLLAKPIITVELFEANPLMGAYFICCAPTSVLVNVMLSSSNFNTPGMMDKVQYAVKKHIKPLKDTARKLTSDHRMYIPELQNFPGMLKQNKKKLSIMLDRKGKTGMIGLGPDDFDAPIIADAAVSEV
ncbi:hypothetical protein O1D97_17955 [Marinomonas sp. 15G1-11]|uniref:Uncharacterized protein n=1 Tax=Marinomonas phaeophyticola TaxID=3004091 RepID=A0ABT4JYH1_9GAMM|nr:hypothetical protein [Marinomonas sp. 15G1-11]MCZ2723442.1 hypothetical protein [Marinomonas sp. 15G1-11]